MKANTAPAYTLTLEQREFYRTEGYLIVRQPVPAILDTGDVLFFNGNVIHGSEPNTHPTLWRRGSIAHCMPSTAEEIVSWHFPLHDFNGRVIERAPPPWAGPSVRTTTGPSSRSSPEPRQSSGTTNGHEDTRMERHCRAATWIPCHQGSDSSQSKPRLTPFPFVVNSLLHLTLP